MVRPLLFFIAVLLSSTGGFVPLGAQGPPPPLELHLAPEDSGAVRVRISEFLEDPSLQQALQSGLPLRIEVVTELWKDGFFDDQRGQHEWGATAVYDPLERRYVLQLRQSDDETRSYGSIRGLSRAVARTLRPDLRPTEEGRYYYQARIEVETLSLSDLEELRRWLRGDLAEAISGEGDVEGAMERGLRRAVIRLLGVPARRFETRTRTFGSPGSPGEESDPGSTRGRGPSGKDGLPGGTVPDRGEVRLDADPR